ncbi:hypothetical protein HUT19_02935 [Streptomyces sp. NA02950]|uniref:hypothetical protein n=1 Tax=Streptomyces sp. NA02950 TaxID=2742137 RepID=UPI0015901B10|nr:hypothetical protein [Streptomyces sp. NA02950]QKV90823.1 hypothetical protein HUT19_02935 [Streptomyces sp. NA02950]
MNYLRGFIPWIAFAVVSSLGWQWGALAGLVIGAGLLVQQRKSGVDADALVLEGSTVVFFAGLTALSFARPHSALESYGGALALGWLAVTAWVTVAVRRPFTTGIARRQAPREVWGTPLFRRINVVITAVWATAFTLSAAALAAVHAADLGDTASTAVQVAGFVLPAMFTARYPERARARALEQTAPRV